MAPSSTAPAASSVPPLKLPLRVEWECGDTVGLYIDDDEQALLMTAQDGVSRSLCLYFVVRVLLIELLALNSDRMNVSLPLYVASFQLVRLL